MAQQINSKTNPSKPRARRTLSGAENLAPQKLKLLVTIVGRNKTEFYIDLIESLGANVQLSTLGHGTASTETLRLLGLSGSEKSVIFSIIRADRAKEALGVLGEKFSTVRGGKGIAYTIPLKSVVGVAIYQFLSNNRMSINGKGE